MGEDFRLKWNDHHSVFFSSAEQLCHGDHLTDVTLSCGTKEFSAHKLVLSICSNYFNQLFAPRPEGHSRRKRPADSAAIVYLKDVDAKHMELLLNYMYRGEINVEEKELMGLLATAKGLQIKGLTESDNEEDESEETNAENTEVQNRPSNTSNKRPAVSRPSASATSSQQPSSKKIKEEHIPKHESLITEDHEQSVVDEDASGTHHDPYPNQASNSQYVDMEDPSELIDQSDYSLDGNQSGEAMVYEGDPENSGMELSFSKLYNDTVGRDNSNDKKCQFCEKTFGTRWKLLRHERSHTGERPYSCPLCPHTSITKDSLKMHCQTKHRMTPEVYYKEVFPHL